MILEVRYWQDGLPEWARILDVGRVDWVTASRLDVIDTSDATAG